MMKLRSLSMYVIRELRANYDDPFWWRNRLFHRVIGPFHTNVYPTRAGSVTVPSADWDTLVVLDACRADLFEARANIDRYDEYRAVTSRGSATQEWTIQNWVRDTFGDTVYVTTNPFVSREAGDRFYKLYEPWLTHFDETNQTVKPADTTEVAIQAHEAHPNKRIVVHYMQPHHPFITAPDLQFQGWDIPDFDDWTAHKDETGLSEAQRNAHPHTPWEALYMGTVSRDAVWNAYAANLDLVLEAVDDLLSAISGRTVITSDHGNMFGERTWPIPLRVYGHPSRVRNPELVDVPWAVVDEGSRRDTVLEEVHSTSASEQGVVEDRLADLGYI